MDYLLQWDDPNSNEDGFKIYLSESPIDESDPPTPLVDLPASTNKYLITELNQNKIYHAMVSTYINNPSYIESFSREVTISFTPFSGKVLTINPAKVHGTHTDFPVYIKPSAITNFGSLTQAQADSIRIYDKDIQELPREIVGPDEIHVKMPTVSGGDKIYIEYDGESPDYAVTDAFGARSVWNDYILTHHMSNYPAINSASLPLSKTSSKGSPTIVDGKMGEATYFDESSEVTYEGNDTSYLERSFTMQINITVEKDRGLWWNLLKVGQLSIQANRKGKNAYSIVNENGNNWHNSSLNFPLGVYSIISVSYNATDGSINMFFNGDSIETNIDLGKVSLYGTFIIGRTGGSRGKATIDECRVSKKVLSLDWIKTEYNNQLDPSTFFI